MHKGISDLRKVKSSEEMFNKKNNFESNTFPDPKISCINKVIKILWYWHKVKRER